MVDANSKASRIIGIDVGGTGIKLGAVDASSFPPKILHAETLHGHDRVPFEETMDRLAKRVEEVGSEVGWDSIQGIGLGVPGLVLHREGILKEAPNLSHWNGCYVRKALEERLNLPVAVDNDANAFALAEWLWGAGEQSADSVFLTLGTGIGGGVFANGRMIRGNPGFASEPGHVVIAPKDLTVKGGTTGEAEWYVGNKYIVKRALEHPHYTADPLVAQVDPLTPKDLYLAAEKGSPVAKDVWGDVGNAIGELLVTMVNILNPERVVFGGGVAQAREWIFEPARKYLGRHGLIARHAPPKIFLAALGKEAGLLGAAGLMVEREALEES
ncbi:MAG: ROK family protein [Candidatus Eisenbacteria bacterium]|uniref:ROK family protein n=1 Tax=Eiseniibacteriota bacterium TaxID=2212470 RepID=A0A7Y2E903_UNCEI|nr:ROK family protein [Candidatus Eisenbacteria bacterium]